MAPWAPSELCACPLIEQLAAEILGPAAFQRYWGGNCSLPATEREIAGVEAMLAMAECDDAFAAVPLTATVLRRMSARCSADTSAQAGLQDLHMDSNYPWSWHNSADAAAAEQPWPHPAQRLFFNFGLFEMDPLNGSTELWPGTHREISVAGPKGSRPFTADLLEARRVFAPPMQVLVPRGAVLMRDVRVWHRAMPNRSPHPRHMLGIGYNAATDPVGEEATRESNNGRRHMVFSEDVRADFEAAWLRNPDYGLERNVIFEPGNRNTPSNLGKKVSTVILTSPWIHRSCRSMGKRAW
eukprot:SAG31_NODE_16_length_36206_cov_27.355728_40_plen_297_part_00